MSDTHDADIFRAFLQGSSDNIYVFGPDGRYTHVSHGGGQSVGLSPDDMIGRTWRELGLPESIMSGVDEQIARVRTTGQTLRHEIKFNGPAGPRVYEYVMSPAGPYVIVVSRDVTDRVNAEVELQRATERYRSFVANSSEGIWRFELDQPVDAALPAEQQIEQIFERGFLAECNDAMARMYGFEVAEEIVGARLPDLLAPDREENHAYLRAFIESGYRLIDAHSTETDRNGRTKYFSNSLTGVIEQGYVLRAWGTQRDVTAEHEHAIAETTRAEFIAAANDLFAQSLDLERTLRNLAKLAVPHLADWCAVDLVDEDGKPRRLAVEHRDPEKVRFAFEIEEKYPSDRQAQRGLQLVLRTGRTDWMPVISQDLLRSVAKSREHFELIQQLRLGSYVCAPIRVNERILGALTIVNAETSRAFTESDVFLAEQLALRAGYAIENARLYQQALDANRAKDEFLATLSHELRTPLTSILGWANLLRLSSYDQDLLRTAVDTIEKSAKAQATLIDDILDVSRIITGKFALNLTATDLVAVVQNVVALARPAAEAKRITIETTAPPSLTLQADANRLQQIIWNLVSNALKFSSDGGRIDVTITRDANNARVDVCDRGAGIEPHVLPRVFERFWQADSSTNRSQGGLGLGLAIVKHLTELHGGSVSASSEGAGKGATFSITLPVRPVAQDDTTSPSPRGQTRVLLVDDDEDARTVIGRTLQHFGAAVTSASSATEALEKLENGDYDLLLTDVAMPERDGYWLLGEVRKRKPDLRVAAITALGNPDEHFARSGFDGCVRKPVDPRKLATLLEWQPA